ncbi:tetratricopeptide repeat protein [Pseudomonas sp. 22-AL-CL-001]|uniref:tetratricopeptide repeat protein n=1 Tax=Pseudomonas alabamensis TaxID=3064349 RepID=UPI0027131083|nr:tetratricopeptide repeat protein [Pseudomonas sp. 22-AL-CL-001]MDO7912816.1 tetratricopeptide repeat protein [Pseudomonas sp. 22-AL-CL-001]
MSAVSTFHSLLEHLLPTRIVPLAQERVRRDCLGLGLPSRRTALGNRFTLISRLDEAVDLQSVYTELRAQALSGSVTVLTDLGWLWLNGTYWQANPLLARRLFRMAGRQGDATAWFNLAEQAYAGRGVEVSHAEAARCYEHAFEAGMDRAAAALGDLFEEGWPSMPFPRSAPSMAYRWFLKGAQRGEARCRFEVGRRLLQGTQVELDVKAGLYWLELAAAGGVVQAAETLTVYFAQGDGAPYRHWRDHAILLGSRLALGLKLRDQVRC